EWFNLRAMPGEKAVANYDEDSLTMAVAASLDCIESADRENIDGLYLATTTAPYRERESASIIATALDLKSGIRTADFADSLKAGTSALLLATDSVKSGGVGNILICASDCRLGKPGSSQELIFGDGAAAFLIGNDGVIASLEGSYSVSYDFPDHWRAAYDRFDRSLEERWIRDEGYTKFIPEAVTGLLKKYQLEAKDFARVIYPCLYPREYAAIGKKLGFEPGQIQEPLLATAGDSGTASPLIMLAVALDEAQPGDNILVVSYGSGSEALWFKVTEQIARKNNRIGIKGYLAARQELTSYEKYLAFRGILPVEVGFRGEVGPTQLPVAWRERRAILSLCGSRCKRCNTPQYPPGRICANPDCGAIDEIEDYRFSDKQCSLFSYTEDRLAFSLSPPQIYGMIDFEGGGRYIFDITDCTPGSLKVDMPMEMTLRRKYADEVRGIYGYSWKAMPPRKTEGGNNA
ncbi:hydroxymethylglutaryl-CoA synthase family protein, partial [Chloroflexota bacterium]